MNRNVNGTILGKDSELALIPKPMYLSRVKPKLNLRDKLKLTLERKQVNPKIKVKDMT